MAKIVTSEGIQDFVASGKPTEIIENDQTQAARAKKVALNAKLAATDAPVLEAPTPPAPPPEEKIDAPKAPEAPKEPVKEPSESDLDDEEKKLAKDIQKKIFKQIAKRKEAQSEAATAREEAAEAERFAEQQFNERQLWQKRAEEAERKVSEPAKAAEPVKEAVAPNPEDKKYYDAENKFKVWEYSADLAKHAADKAIADDRRAQTEALAKQQQEADAARFRDRVAAAEKKYDGKWKSTIDASDITLQNEALQYLARSDTGTDVAFWLALPENRKEAERIRGLHPILAIAELGKIETGLTKTAAPPATAALPVAEPARSAPAPITPISTSGGGPVNLDPAKMNFKELLAYERARNTRR